MSELRYGCEKTLENETFDGAVWKVTESLRAEGFGVLTEIDVRQTLKKKLDVDFRRYVIFDACNPVLARRAFGRGAALVQAYLNVNGYCNKPFMTAIGL